MSILEKLTSRNFLAVSTGSVFLYIIYNLITVNPDLLENPIITGLLGVFGTLTALVYQFYFRTSGNQE